MTPNRGDVRLFDLGMTEKVRPGLVVSVGYGDVGRALIIVPHNTGLPDQFELAFAGLFRWLGDARV